jgi:DNA-binding CsgD family transcriptional regulator
MYNRTIASLAELRLRQGRLDEAEALIEGVEAPIETSLVAAALALRREQPLVATMLLQRWLRSEADPVVPPIHAGGRGLSIEMACALGLLVEARLAAGDLEGAVATADDLRELPSTSGASLAAAHAALALARIARGQGIQEVAVRYFEEALALFGQLELPLEGARTRVELARALAPRQPALAVGEARTALSVLDRLGASADADIAAALLRSWGAAGRSVPRQSGLLTRREKEILALLAAGLSNQEIADRLYISRRTAAHHVSNLFAKLSVRNRAEAVAFAARSRAETEVVSS